MKRGWSWAIAPAALAIVLAACSDSEGIDVEEAQEAFCADLSDYVDALGAYGGLFEDVDLTVGDVKGAADELEPGREAVLDSAETFREAVEADPDSAVTIEVVEPESIEAVEDAEAAFADASDISDSTTVVEAGVNFTSAAYQLQVAWVRLFVDAGCIPDEDQAEASQWVSDYVSALQTDLRVAGYYDGEVDGIYGPSTIAAVEQLQEDAGLPVTGLMDPASQQALALLLGTRTSAQIGALQGILISTGYYDGPVDGIWSDALEASLKELQTDLGVGPTGVVDAATLRAFEEALAEAGQPPVTTTTAPGAVTPTTAAPPEETTTTEAPAATTTTSVTTTAPAPTLPSVLDVLAEAGEFDVFLDAIETAGLTERLSGPGPFTIFAPTDEAFDGVDVPTDPEALAALVLYHVVEEDLDGFALQELDSVTTAEGSDIEISVEAGLIVLNDESTVTVTNVLGGNGQAHVINTLLGSPTLLEG